MSIILENLAKKGIKVAPTAEPKKTGIAGITDAIMKPASDVLVGAAKGLGSTISNIGEMGAKGLDILTLQKPQQYNTEQDLANLGIENALTPTNTAQQIGFGVEQVGEFLAPGGAISKGVGLASKGIKGAQLAKAGAGLARGLGAGRTGAKIGAKLAEGGAKLGANMLGEGIAGAGVTLGQGGDLGDAAGAGILSAAFPLAGAGAKALKSTAPAKFIAEKLPSRLIDSILKPLEKEFRFSKDPGRGVVKEGIKANTREGLAKQITSKKKEIGKEIDGVLNARIHESKIIDVAPALNEIDAFIAKANNIGEPALVQRLQAVKKGLTDQFQIIGGKSQSKALSPIQRDKLGKQLSSLKQDQARAAQGGMKNKTVEKQIADIEAKLSPDYGKKITELTPKQAAELKRQIGEATQWTGQAFDNDVNQARAAVYRTINEMINAKIPTLKNLNSRYADILGAEKSMERQLGIGQRQSLVGLPEAIVATGVGGASFASGETSPETLAKSLLAYGAIRSLKSPALVTRVAQQLSKLTPDERTVFAKISPIIKSILLEINSPTLKEQENK